MGTAERTDSLAALFRELSSGHRLRFLIRLDQEPETASRLARMAGLSVQEAMRHLGRLLELGLVVLRGNREYALTPWGRLLVRELAPYHEARVDAAAIVNQYDLSFVPAHLKLAPLLVAPQVRGPETENLVALESMMVSSKSFLYRLSGQTFWNILPRLRSGGERVFERLEQWIGVYTPAAVLNERFLGLPEDMRRARGDLERLHVRIRIAPAAPAMLAVNDEEAIVFLPRADGTIDLSTMVQSREEPFRDWATALFRHYERRAVRAFDTARGDRFEDWRARIETAARSVQGSGGGGQAAGGGALLASPPARE